MWLWETECTKLRFLKKMELFLLAPHWGSMNVSQALDSERSVWGL